ncbi:hypothetical protein EAE96_009958 [Botrytis aclada]|nr:hypothetical protein EAE96_009958 [Botrytis aclada]
MINQMDLVYSNACATIVAASGNSASDGLPGISVPRYQAHADIGETHLIEVSNVVEEIMLSKWFTRGWAYQEWYFSRRRLIFSDSEVVFLCNEEIGKEAISGQNFCPFGHNEQKLQSMNPQWSNHQIESSNLQSQIEVYSKRDLSHDCDSLNAFAGILRHFESATKDYFEPLSHLWGVPLQLHAYPEGKLVIFDLMWYHTDIAHRRDGLPSWSWSGWGGSVKFGSYRLQIQPTTVEMTDNELLAISMNEEEGVTSEVVLRIQIPFNGGTIDLDDFCRKNPSNLHHDMYWKELHITSFIIPLRFRGFHEDGRNLQPSDMKTMARSPPIPIMMPTFNVRPYVYVGVPVHFDREYESELHNLGLVIPSAGRFYEYPDIYNIVVLHPVADGKYERAGFFTLNYDTRTGDIEDHGSSAWPIYLLDQNDDPISRENPKHMNSRNKDSYKYSFLESAEWKTICLV